MTKTVFIVILLVCASAAVADPRNSESPLPSPTFCDTLKATAVKRDLPFPFFAKLIWQESRFDPAARSPAGAQGVAQFMPATATERGLADPFDPARSIDESAAYLSELRRQFGNIGLAAAGYNAGPGRLARWIAGTASLPAESRAYVLSVTGHSVEEWQGANPPSLDLEIGFSCASLAGDAGRRPTPRSISTTSPAAHNLPDRIVAPKPWAVILVGNFRRDTVRSELAVVRATFRKVLGSITPSIVQRHLGSETSKKYVAQIETADQASGADLCKRLESAGGNCVVLRNSSR
jgi:hypothetical protein